MKDIRVVRGTLYVHQLVAQGEHFQQDFKYAISDARKIARSISAFANNDGGRLLIGVKDNGVIAGVRNEEDIYVVEQAARRYCSPPVDIDFKAYRVDGASMVIEAIIPRAAHRPVHVRESDGTLRAYYRVADQNITASALMVEAWRRAGVPVAFDELHSAVAAYVGHADSAVDVRDIALALHIGASRAASIVADLAAADIVRFIYLQGDFRIMA